MHGTANPFPIADPHVAVCLTGRIAAALLEKRQANWIFSAVRDQRWWLRGAYILGKCRFENKPPPQSRVMSTAEKGGAYFREDTVHDMK